MMKMGGTLKAVVGKNTVNVSLDTAPTFAAELVVKDQPITNLFTASTNTCPTLSADGTTFTDAACPTANGLKTAGVLTDPGAMAQFYSNMSFRRVRWIQESFACTTFPAEFSAKPVAMGNGQFTSPWPFTSITGGASAQINFQDTSSIICANCHTTMNHFAPLFANFDAAGVVPDVDPGAHADAGEPDLGAEPTGCRRARTSTGASAARRSPTSPRSARRSPPIRRCRSARCSAPGTGRCPRPTS